MEPLLTPRTVVALLVCAGYFTVAQRVANLYPFSTFSMYSRHTGGDPSRVVARDARGVVYELDGFAAWNCPPRPPLEQLRCPEAGPRVEVIDYLDRDADAYLRAHAAPAGDVAGGTPVDVVRRVWLFAAASGPIRTVDCVLARCTARPR